eukprot:g3000.t1
MAALAAEEPVQIKIRGAFKGKLSVLLGSCTVGQLKAEIAKAAAAAAGAAGGGAAAAEQLGRDFELKLIVKGKVLAQDSALLGASGIKKSSLVKAIKGVASDAQKKAAALSSTPGEKSMDAGPRQRCKGGCGFWGSALTDWYCSSCYKAKSGVEEPPRWEFNDGGWTRFPASTSKQLELARKSGKVNLMNYGAQGHPQRIDLRKLTMTPTRGPRQGRATMLRRVPPTHPGTFMTEAEWQKKQDGEVAKKKEEEEAAKLEAEKQKRLDRLNAMTQCCLAGCKKKLKLSDTPCRCELRFCLAHRLPENHRCTYDFTKRANDNLKERIGEGGGKFDQLRTGSRDRL